MARKLNKRDWGRVGEFIRTEFRRREEAPRRVSLEKQWKEIDRQVRMEPKPRQNRQPGDDSNSWMSEFETPDQAGTLGDMAAESRRLMFGVEEDWYKANVVFSDRLAAEIEAVPLHHGDESGETLGSVAQDTANLIVKSTMDHFHRLYNHRAHWDAMLVEAHKYGTYAGRGALVDLQAISGSFRNITGPLVIPVILPLTIKNTYLDDRSQFVMMEGISVRPADIRRYWQYIPDIQRAAKKASKRDDTGGWIAEGVEALQANNKDKRQHAELVEYEGDLFISRSQGEPIFLGAQIVTIDMKTALPIRIRKSTLPFRSYISGYYEQAEADSPYGTGPLMKGRTLQELASEAGSRTADAAALNTEPPIAWDTGDTKLQATGGPVIAPGETWETDSPESVKPQQIGDPQQLFAIFAGARQMYDQLLKRQEPRGSGAVKSHTTAFANDAALSRGILPTEDFIEDLKHGGMKDSLYMEFALGKEALKRTQTVLVTDAGSNTHIDVSARLWPDRCDFNVTGALGALSKREERETFSQTVAQVAQIEQIAVQLGGTPSDWDEIRREMYRKAGITDAERFFAKQQGVPGETQTESGVPEDIGDALGVDEAGAEV